MPSMSPLCTSGIVRDTCLDFEADYDDNTPDDLVTRQMVADAFVIDDSMADELWRTLRLGSNSSVLCMDLCQAAVQYVSRFTQLPPDHDKACYRAADGGVACDLDVSMFVLKEVSFTGDLPNHYGDDRFMPAGLRRAQAIHGLKHVRRQPGDSAQSSNTTRRLSEGEASAQAALAMNMLVERVANAFQIFPAPGLGAPALGVGASEGDAACVTNIWRVAQKAKVWVISALTKVQRRETRLFMQKWFGETAAATRKEVLRVLRSVESVLGHFSFVILPSNPKTCDASTFGFVMNNGEEHCDAAKLMTGECKTDSAGRKVVYLCNLYCKSSEKVQINTLTHEASHHMPADTDDVPPEPYGREECLDMAHNRPWDAIRNADNYCFYVMDMVHSLNERCLLKGTCVSATTAAATVSRMVLGGWVVLLALSVLL